MVDSYILTSSVNFFASLLKSILDFFLLSSVWSWIFFPIFFAVVIAAFLRLFHII